MAHDPEFKGRIEVQPQREPVTVRINVSAVYGGDVASVRCALGLTDDGSRPSQATLAPDYVPPEVAARRAKAPRRFVTPTDLHIPGEWD